jgi:hypothetical protein
MAPDALISLAFLSAAPAGGFQGKPKKPNPTNHMRQPAGGAFVLPS